MDRRSLKMRDKRKSSIYNSLVPVSAVPEGEDDGAGPLQNLEAVAELVRDGCRDRFTIRSCSV